MKRMNADNILIKTKMNLPNRLIRCFIVFFDVSALICVHLRLTALGLNILSSITSVTMSNRYKIP